MLTATLLRPARGALTEVPRANASYRDGRFELYSRINVGVIVATGGAFVPIPTLFDCERKSVPELADELATLARNELEPLSCWRPSSAARRSRSGILASSASRRRRR